MRRIGSDCHLPKGEECRCEKEFDEDRKRESDRRLRAIKTFGAIFGVFAVLIMIGMAVDSFMSQKNFSLQAYLIVVYAWMLLSMAMGLMYEHETTSSERHLQQKEIRCAVRTLLVEREYRPKVTDYEIELMKDRIKELEDLVDELRLSIDEP